MMMIDDRLKIIIFLFSFSSQKISTILLCVHCTIAEPQLSGKEYLPPQEGYNYGAPSIPFPSPQPTYRPPPPPTPIYNPPPPAYSTPRPTFAPPRPTYGPPLESGSAISPVGQEGAGTGGGEVSDYEIISFLH